MTYLEKAKLDNHSMTYDDIINDCCPYDFGYEDYLIVCPYDAHGNCIKCWARDYEAPRNYKASNKGKE